MLRVSTQTTGNEFDLAAVNGDADLAARDVNFGGELIRFAEAVARHDEPALAEARQRLLEVAGPKVTVDAAGVAANFQRMVRIADATGIPADHIDSDLSREIRTTLGLGSLASAVNTPGSRD
jgi:DNA-binding phage protein